MANRHALLIGIPSYDDEELDEERLGAAVTSDMYAMRSALEESGYEITECGTNSSDGEGRGATLNRINQAIEDACANVPAGGVLLIYFTGHGVTVNGRDYLVPSDAYRPKGAQPGSGPFAVRSLVPVVPDTDVLRDCRAALVVSFVDACRNDPAEDITLSQAGLVGAGAAAEPGGQQPFLAGGGQFVLVMGCGADQVCRYDETGSVFTRALAQVLDPRNPARTLQEVVDEAAAVMARRSRQTQGERQEPSVRNPDLLKLAGQVVVCDGDQRAAAWRKAVEGSQLLPLCDNPEQVQAVVAECARRCGEAEEALRTWARLTDPWADQDYPGRVLRNCELLLRHAALLAPEPAGLRLRSGEAALLLAAPFLREAVLAEGIKEAAHIEPADLRRTYTPGARSDLELTHEMHQHLARRASALRLRALWRDAGGAADAAGGLAMWLVHRWLAGRARLWEEAGAAEACRVGAELTEGYWEAAGEAEVPRLVQALLLAVGAEPVDERLLVKLSSAYVSDRWRAIASVLWLAGIMAVDPRRLPPVVADLVGTGMELSLADVRDAASRRAEWAWTPAGGLDLRLVCEHPALHDAFEEVVRRADRATATIRAGLSLAGPVAERLPRGFSATGLRPATRQDEEPAYDVPLSRFQIAEEKVRELLMGRQLYGDPALAIRELYQNALDACRWRATRQEYRHRKNGEQADWTGLISFTQSTDDDGRPYIECVDNGVGMDLNTLKHVFANAGERFVYGQKFRAEQADWADLDPPLQMVSNSQFGVGVFSYFMLADEITVLTRHQRRNGVVDPQAYEVRIANSGSLFQIRPVSGLISGGTRIRLYLSGDAPGVSVLSTLRSLVWIAEHRLMVSDQYGSETWEPGELRYQAGDVQPLKCGEDLWWVPGQGGLAADGITTGAAMFGLVVNLRGEHRPQFTVDRKTLRAFDADWVDDQVGQYLADLVDWPGFTFSWLWAMAQAAIGRPAPGRDLSRVQQIFQQATNADKHLAVTGGPQEQPVPVRITGCMPADSGLVTGQTSATGSDAFKAWRAGVWQHLGREPLGLLDRFSDEELIQLAPERITGLPVPDATDGAMLVAWNGADRYGKVSAQSVLSAVAKVGRTPEEGLRRYRRYAITGIDVSVARRFFAYDRFLSEDDVALIMSLPAWDAEEKMSRAELVRALVKTACSSRRSPWDAVYRARLRGIEGSFNTDPDHEQLVDEAAEEADRIWRHAQAEDSVRLLDDPGPAKLIAWAKEPGMSMAAVLDRCDSLARLGCPVPGAGGYQADFTDTELFALQEVRSVGAALSMADLLLVASRACVSLRAAYDALARLAERGLLVRPELNGPGDYVPTAQDAELIKREWPTGERILLHEAAAGQRRRLWMRVAQIIARPRRKDEDLLAPAQHLAPVVAPAHALTYPQLVDAAWLSETTLADTAAALRAVYPAIQLPDLPAECGDLTVSTAVRDVLLADEDEISWRPRPAPYHIIDQALGSRLHERPAQALGDFLSRLARFSAIGAMVPPCTEADRAALNGIRLDERDLSMLESGKYVVLRVWPLHLVQMAGRFGWTLAEAHRRFARLTPIGLGFTYPQAELPDDIVYWYDLQALTTHFDGQEPLISGRIDRAYLEQAAREIFYDASPAELPAKVALLRERLAVYAPLFELELDIPQEDPVA